MPHTSQRGARSKLADVLAVIKNSREDEDNNVHSGPRPAKRRSAVNCSQTPHHYKSPGANNGQTSASKRTYILKLIDRPVDLTPFLTQSKDKKVRECALYPIARSWVGDQPLPERNHTNTNTNINPENSESQNQNDDQQQQQQQNEQTEDEKPADYIMASIIGGQRLNIHNNQTADTANRLTYQDKHQKQTQVEESKPGDHITAAIDRIKRRTAASSINL